MDSLVHTDPFLVSTGNPGHPACLLVSVAQVMGTRGSTDSETLPDGGNHDSIDCADHIGGFIGDQHDIFRTWGNTFVRPGISPVGPSGIRGERDRIDRDDLQHLGWTSV